MTDREIMQQALEKLEFFAHMKSVSEDTRRLITALRERLAQPEHKPMHPTLQKMWEDYFDKCYKREWVGLTDDEIIDVIHPLVMADMADEATDYEIARAIEAALREKNT